MLLLAGRVPSVNLLTGPPRTRTSRLSLAVGEWARLLAAACDSSARTLTVCMSPTLARDALAALCSGLERNDWARALTVAMPAEGARPDDLAAVVRQHGQRVSQPLPP